MPYAHIITALVPSWLYGPSTRTPPSPHRAPSPLCSLAHFTASIVKRNPTKLCIWLSWNGTGKFYGRQTAYVSWIKIPKYILKFIKLSIKMYVSWIKIPKKWMKLAIKNIFSIWKEKKQSWGVWNETQSLSSLLIVMFIAKISVRLTSI